jgi:hypothetical protein
VSKFFITKTPTHFRDLNSGPRCRSLETTRPTGRLLSTLAYFSTEAINDLIGVSAGIYIYILVHTTYTIAEGVAKVSQIFLRDTHC